MFHIFPNNPDFNQRNPSFQFLNKTQIQYFENATMISKFQALSLKHTA